MLQFIRQNVASGYSRAVVGLSCIAILSFVFATKLYGMAAEDTAATAQIKRQIDHVITQLRLVREQNAAVPETPGQPMPEVAHADAFVTDLHIMADKHNVTVLTADLAERPASSGLTAGTTIRVTAKGDYPAAKRMVGAAMALHGYVALDALNIRRARTEEATLDVEMRFTIFHRAAP